MPMSKGRYQVRATDNLLGIQKAEGIRKSAFDKANHVQAARSEASSGRQVASEPSNVENLDVLEQDAISGRAGRNISSIDVKDVKDAAVPV